MKHILCVLALLAASAASTLPASPDNKSGNPPANPIEQELFPPDFLFAQREALGLSEAQLQELQTIVQNAAPKFEDLKGLLEVRTKALHEALLESKPDIAQTDEKLRAMLAQENQMKIFQVHLLLTLREKLTGEQVQKARQLRPQFTPGSTNPADGLAERLQGKFQKLRTLIEARAANGQPPEDIVSKARDIQQLVQNGKPLEAERKLDELLSTLAPEKARP
jgi:hypothetical protein